MIYVGELEYMVSGFREYAALVANIWWGVNLDLDLDL